ncbi:ImmA/IrrE family metallo-endopeptidase [Gluconobacter cerinus]|uniref:ImmA/IrrE family metallo-endopeptidase n=1 Tax=Gluconobacter cerinus TaxID=38307 RepID=UPI001B8B9428|nr:ImmA/IrrE family metallo-endopeptidase [Gluconobacter cerinus]MBS1037766.1 ImmA/IrrE family metallo-endopeptidase [Gluconobacter cerinus]
MRSKEWNKLSTDIQDVITSNQTEAPVKISVLAKDLDVSIKGATLPPGISGEIRRDLTDQDHFIIRINKHEPQKRQRFTAAHELAHYLLHRDHIGAGLEDGVLFRSNNTDRIEAEANRLAADILIPNDLLERAVEDARSLGIENLAEYVSECFDVSEAVARIKLES